ncbi:MAG: MnhB domain-containing protein, partial [Planctomycetota bacterium]
MNSLIFRAAARLLLPLLLLFSLIILGVGHNEPGGGFVGGLVASAAVAMYAMAFGAPAAKRLLRLWNGKPIG